MAEPGSTSALCQRMGSTPASLWMGSTPAGWWMGSTPAGFQEGFRAAMVGIYVNTCAMS